MVLLGTTVDCVWTIAYNWKIAQTERQRFPPNDDKHKS